MGIDVNTVIFQLFNGLVWGCMMGLVALGLALIFGQMGVVNMAHGEFYMVGAVGAYLFVASLGLNFWISILLVAAAMAILGAVLERGVMRPFEGKAAPSMVAALGLSFIIQQLALITLGGAAKQTPSPISGVVALGDFRFPTYRLVVALVALALIGLCWLLIQRTRFGMAVRACMRDPQTAAEMGINTGLVSMSTFGLGTAMAGVGGALAAPISQVFFLMGQDVIAFAFIAVIVGGLGSLQGALVAAIALAVVEGLLTIVLSPALARASVFLIMTVVLVFRPRGLFGKR